MDRGTLRRRGVLAAAVVLVGVCGWLIARDVGEETDRFDELDRRIEGMLPKDQGSARSPEAKGVGRVLRVDLVRLDAEDAGKARTRASVGGEELVLAHESWGRGPEADAASERRRDEFFAKIQAKIAQAFARDRSLKGEIATPSPRAGAVPRADVMRVLDCFLGVGITEVNFAAGNPPPR